MKPGAELNALVAQKVMGIGPIEWNDETPCPYCEQQMRYCGARSRCDNCGWIYGPYKDYSTDISAAMEVVEKMAKSYTVEIEYLNADGDPDNGAVCSIAGVAGPLVATVPHAICLAALKAVGA